MPGHSSDCDSVVLRLDDWRAGQTRPAAARRRWTVQKTPTPPPLVMTKPRARPRKNKKSLPTWCIGFNPKTGRIIGEDKGRGWVAVHNPVDNS